MTQSGPHVLVVDDEPAIRRFLKPVLTAHGYVVSEAGAGGEAVIKVKDDKPDLVILDLGLPDMNGVEVTRLLREWSRVPILVLSVRTSEADKIAALDAGADDYLTKPFGVGELLARLRAALRHTVQGSEEPVYDAGGLRVDLAKRLVAVDSQEVQVTPTEYALLRVLVLNAGRVLTHRQLLREVWGAVDEEHVHLLRVNMSNLRRKLEPDPARQRYIITEPGVGYRLRSGDATPS